MENNTFLHYFTFSKKEPAKSEEKNVVFHDCILLQPIGNKKKGDKVDAICIGLEFLMWEGDKLIEDETIFY